jgi:hypothetical protein
LLGESLPIKPDYTGALKITYSKLVQIGDEKGFSTGPKVIDVIVQWEDGRIKKGAEVVDLN